MKERERRTRPPRRRVLPLKLYRITYIFNSTHTQKHTRIIILKSNHLSLLLKLKFEFNEYRRVFLGAPSSKVFVRCLLVFSRASKCVCVRKNSLFELISATNSPHFCSRCCCVRRVRNLSLLFINGHAISRIVEI